MNSSESKNWGTPRQQCPRCGASAEVRDFTGGGVLGRALRVACSDCGLYYLTHEVLGDFRDGRHDLASAVIVGGFVQRPSFSQTYRALLGRALKPLRLAANLSHNQLWRLTGIEFGGPEMVARLENGSSFASPEQLVRFLAVCGLTAVSRRRFHEDIIRVWINDWTRVAISELPSIQAMRYVAYCDRAEGADIETLAAVASVRWKWQHRSVDEATHVPAEACLLFVEADADLIVLKLILSSSLCLLYDRALNVIHRYAASPDDQRVRPFMSDDGLAAWFGTSDDAFTNAEGWV